MARRRTSGGSRPKPHNVTFPLTPSGVEGINQNFDALFRDLRNATTGGTQLLGPGVGDVEPASPQPGDMIVGSQENPSKWQRFAIGAANTVLRSLGNLQEWAKVHLGSDVDGTLPVANGGSGRASATAYAVITGGTTGTGAHQSIASLGTLGQVLTSNGAAALPTMEDPKGVIRSITFSVDGGGAVITVGHTDYIRIPIDCIIESWSIISDQVGDIVIDVWKDTFANAPPTVGDSITDGNDPELAGAQVAEDTNLADWLDVTVDAGDYIGFSVTSVTDIEKCTLQLFVRED